MTPEIKTSLPARISALLRFLGEILDSFWAFVVSLPSKLTAPFKKSENLVTPEDDTEKKCAGPPKEPPIVPNVMPPPPSDQESNKCRYPKTPWWKTALEFIAVGAVIWYTVETHRTNTLTDQALGDARKNFAQDQRPWVWVEAPELFHLKVGDVPRLNFQIINYGKTPAIARTVVFLYAEPIPNPQTIRTYQQAPVPFYEYILPPGAAKTSYSTAHARDILGKKEYDLIMSGQATVIAGGRVVYRDLGGNSYESVFCVTPILPSGTPTNCPAPELNHMK